MIFGSGAWPDSDIERVPACPVCRAEERRPLYEGLADRVFFTAAGTWSLQECVRCRCAFLDPRPTRESIARAYRGYYTHDAGVSVAVPEWRQALINGYYRSRYACTATPVVAAGRWIVPLFPARRRTIDFTARHLALPRPGARLLDVGSGSGAAVHQSRELGWDAVGLEPDPAAVDLARKSGLPVDRGTLETATFADGEFDAITMNHVLEHVHEPRTALEMCRRLLRPGGRLWIATPNLASAGHAHLQRDWLHLDPPRHLVLFRSKPLTTLLRTVGFTQVEHVAPPPTAQRIFAAAEAMRVGSDPVQPRVVSSRMRVRARAVDVLSHVRPRFAEELVVLAS